ncbi:MAG: hypothetical protein O3A95_09730 [Planctomycetota bacterium]|nr:hypothetical protein [Planctomycetota bacterium]
MRIRSVFGLLVPLCLLGSVSCNFIPPYSDIKKQEVSGFHTLKFRGAAYSDMDALATDTVNNPPVNSSDLELDSFSSFGFELERLIGNQISATASLDQRQYHQINDVDLVKATQMAIGMRKYFGSRAVTAFLTGQLMYNFGLEFQTESLESDGFLGYGAGGGVNWALSEDFSIEAYIMYEGMPRTPSHIRGDDAVDSGFEHQLSGIVGYVAIGFHF